MEKLRVGSAGTGAYDSSNCHVRTIPKPVKIYDVDKKELIASFDTVAMATKHLGICSSHVQYIIKNKSRYFSKKLGITITCR